MRAIWAICMSAKVTQWRRRPISAIYDWSSGMYDLTGGERSCVLSDSICDTYDWSIAM